MRDLLNELLDQEQRNPMEAARRNMRPVQRKRFYKGASVGQGNALLLDDKPVRTPARRLLAAPDSRVAQALAAEWNAQGKEIDPAAMPLTRLANSIIDAVADQPDAVRGEIVKYLNSDLVFYRADSPEGLIARQAELWDRFVDWARDVLDARFVLAQGVIHQAQPSRAVEAVAKTIPRDLWRLGAAASVTIITGSALIALALAAGAVTAEEAWSAAHVDEDWNFEAWGRDEDAMQRRAGRRAEYDAAVLVLECTA
jgi:chaperone required for assembly of F1-ATPase